MFYKKWHAWVIFLNAWKHYDWIGIGRLYLIMDMDISDQERYICEPLHDLSNFDSPCKILDHALCQHCIIE